MTCLLVVLAYASMAAFACAMRGHHRTVFRRDTVPEVRRAWRIIGYALVAAALGVAVTCHGWGGGLVAWIAAVTVGGFALTLLLAVAPRWIVAPIVVAAVAAGLDSWSV